MGLNCHATGPSLHTVKMASQWRGSAQWPQLGLVSPLQRQYTHRLSAVSHSVASDEAFSATGAPAPRHLAAEQASSAAVLAMTTWQPDPVHLVEPVGHAGNAAAQSYRQITAIHRTSAGGLRHPDVDGSRCISGTPAAQRMSRTVSAADFFTPGTTCLARVLAGPSRCTRAVHWARNVACRGFSAAES